MNILISVLTAQFPMYLLAGARTPFPQAGQSCPGSLWRAIATSALSYRDRRKKGTIL